MIIQQRGVALFVVMILLLLMTSAGGLLLRESSLELKLAEATASKLTSEQVLEGAVNELFREESFSQTLITMGKTHDISSQAFSGVTGALTEQGEFQCRRMRKATSTNVVSSCRYVDIRLGHNFGRGGRGQAGVGAGVEQPIIKSD